MLLFATHLYIQSRRYNETMKTFPKKEKKRNHENKRFRESGNKENYMFVVQHDSLCPQWKPLVAIALLNCCFTVNPK